MQESLDNVDGFTKALLKKNFKSLSEKELINKFADIRSVYMKF